MDIPEAYEVLREWAHRTQQRKRRCARVTCVCVVCGLILLLCGLSPQLALAFPTLSTQNILVGHSYDIHKLAYGASKPLIISGVILAGPGVVAHSDGDVVLHVVADAILGALGGPDIGELFPDSNSRWSGLDSEAIVREALLRARRERYRVGDVDVTVVLQRPKVPGSARASMKENLRRILRVR